MEPIPEQPGGAPPPRLRFRRHQHVRRGSDFQRAYREGVRERGQLMTIVVRPNGLPYCRLGLSVGKRCWKQAVRRNRVRRIFRESFRLAQGDLPPGVDIVMIGSVPRIEPHLDAARNELVRLGERARQRLARRAERDKAHDR